MSLKEKLEERVLSFVIGIAVATLGLYLVLIQLLGLSIVRRDEYMLRSEVSENYVKKDQVSPGWMHREEGGQERAITQTPPSRTPIRSTVERRAVSSTPVTDTKAEGAKPTVETSPVLRARFYITSFLSLVWLLTMPSLLSTALTKEKLLNAGVLQLTRPTSQYFLSSTIARSWMMKAIPFMFIRARYSGSSDFPMVPPALSLSPRCR